MKLIRSFFLSLVVSHLKFVRSRIGAARGLALLTCVACVGSALAPAPLCAAVTVTGLRCENLENPLGIDVTQPRLSWILESNERGQKQTAYQVLVASSAQKLRANEGDLWDSGKVTSDQSIQLRYAGRPLRSHQACFWKVRVWDKDGKVSGWSHPAKWSVGPLEPGDWKAKWIGLEGEEKTNWLSGTSWIWFPEGQPEKSASPGTNYFRRVITIPAGRQIRSAIFQYTGDNECRGWLNDQDLGRRNNYRTVKYNDITTRVEPGGTYVFGLQGHNDGTNKPAGVVGLLEIEFTDGEVLVVKTDEQWKVSNRKEEGWTDVEFDDSKWQPARVLGPAGMQPWGNVRAAESRRLPARWLRKEFAVEKHIARATAYVSGVGLSELYLNGEKVSDHVLSPAGTEYPKRIFYVTHDVTPQLRRGSNALGVVLGNGRYYSMRSRVYAGMPTYGFPKLLLHLRIEHTDGTVSEIVSDESWRLTTDGPILANNEYDGEEYDARKELGDWSKAGFDDSKWQRAQLAVVPEGKLCAQMMAPIRVTQTLKPISVKELRPGVFIFDMGQNMVGWCRLTVRGPAGTEVMLRHAEALEPDGSLYMANIRGARVTDIYTLKGKGKEVWEPRFTYHGFRYVEMRGFPGKPTLDALEGRVVHDDVPSAGEFECSNPLLNRIYQNIVWGTRGNYRSFPTDCPQRDERQAWLGDRSEVSRGESFIFDTQAFHEKWLQDIADAQRESGSVPDVAPSYWPIYTDNVTWPSTTVILPGILYDQFADLAIVDRHYDSAKRWVDYMMRFVTNGIISKDNYGDWCVPPEDPKLIHSEDPNRKTDKALLATSFFYHDLRLMERFARLLGKKADAERFGKLAQEINAAFNDRFLKRDLGQYDNGTQTSCVLPLAFGMVPDDMRAAVFDRLVRKIVEETKGHIGTGLIGGMFLNRVLTENGRADLAYTIASQKDYPSWGYMVKQGATTVWELWNGDTADPSMNSGNHVMLIGDLTVWLYESLAGIRSSPDHPGFKHILMKPHPVGDLTFARGTHRSPHGLISSHWRKEGEHFHWEIEVPPNATATVYVPASAPERVTEGGRSLENAAGVKFVRMEQDRAVLLVQSGKYRFRSRTVETDQSGVLKTGFLYETAPFPSCHASTIAETKHGIVASFFGGTHERHPDVGIWVTRFEKGRWTTPVEVANGVESPEKRYPTWNPVLFQPEDGPLILFYKVGPSPSTWWGMLMTSEDGGKTWSKPRRLPDGILGPIKNKPVQLANGDIISPSSTEHDGWRVHFERSSDGGQTWTATPPVNDGRTIRAIQPSILVHPGGKLQALGRTRSQGIFQVWSHDNGNTWGEMGLIDLPNPSSGTDAVTLSDGRHLLVYNHNTREATMNKGRSPLNVAISKDGMNWEAALVLENDLSAPNGFSYPAVIQTSDGLVHITYTWKRQRIKHVVVDPTKLELRPIVNGQWPE